MSTDWSAKIDLSKNYGDSALNYCTLGVTVRIPVKGASSHELILLRCTLRS
jgi:hypothetical protein